MRRTRFRWLRLLLLCAACAACRPNVMVVVEDLAEALPAAELAGSLDVVLFGTPAAQAYEERGFSRGTAGAPERFSWVTPQAQLGLDWADVQPRRAVLDVSPAPGVRRQSLEVRLNGGHVARLRFRERARLLIDLPVRFQRTGLNRLALAFGKAAESEGLGPRRAARVHSLSVEGQSTGSLEALARPDGLPVVEVMAEDGAPSIVQLSGVALRYALRLPAGAELRVRPGVAAGGSGSRLKIALEDQPGRWQELWSRTLASGERGGEIRVDLASWAGRTVRVALLAEAPEHAWARWVAPRILAPEAPVGESPQVQKLRSALQGSNVVLVVLDAAGAGHFSSYGYARQTTPNIDAIAAEGVLFERAYTTGVYTLAAMGSLWASRPPDECSAAGKGLSRLPGSPLTLAQRLSARGIHSAGFVTNPRAGRAYGMDRGFSEFHEVLTKGVRGAQALRETVDVWLRTPRAEPFFLYVHFREPHFPYDPPPPFDARFGRASSLPVEARREQAWIDAVNAGRVGMTPDQLDDLVRLYDGNLAYADAEIGALRATLEATGLWDRSVLVITGDHGEALREHGFIGHNRQVHEESAHVPLLVHFPGARGPSGVRVSALTDHLDLAPTIAQIFGLGEPPPGQEFAGTSLLPLALRSPGRDTVVTRSATGERPVYAIRDQRFTLIRSQRHGQDRLFDAVQDPEERRDLAHELPLEAAYARSRLFLWLARLRPEPVPEAAPELTAEQRAQLKALGYLQ